MTIIAIAFSTRGYANGTSEADREIKPQWIVVPDEVADKAWTITNWYLWEAKLRDRYPGIPLAFAVQNGMGIECVPKTADVIFVGGTFEWKWTTMPMWCQNFPRVHVARVNSWQRLWYCQELGAESCDGTGWFKGVEERHDLHLFLAIQAGMVHGLDGLDLGGLSYQSRSASLVPLAIANIGKVYPVP
ncbi:MAG: hypothetical protein F6K47_04340 [Symploca sp. SIO2E6]|nr:hypothetical protein [Symploca sp. SIO2E6]